MKEEKIFGIYKPKGITSYDVIRELKAITGEKVIGHAGTLDPLAEGVLVVGIGKTATKELKHAVAQEKEYEAEIYLGRESTTDDEEGEKTDWTIQKVPSLQDIEEALSSFKGIISQTPPIYSAIKVKGKEAYKYARRGEHVALQPRNVFIKDVVCVKYVWPILSIRVITGPGVYIRSLARDIGEKLKVGGYLRSLVRTRIGNYTIEHSFPLSQCKEKWSILQKKE